MEKYNQQETNMQGGGFMKLGKESNVRIVSGFSQFRQHYIEESQSSLFCIGVNRGCVECAKNNKPGFRAFVWIIDRDEPEEEKKLKIMPCGWTVHMQIIRLSKGTITQFERPTEEVDGKTVELPIEMMDDTLDTPEYAFDEIPGYDIQILKTLVTDDNLDTRYEVVPQELTERTMEEMDLIEKKVTDLDLIVKKMEEKVLSPEKVQGEGADGSLDEIEYPKEGNNPEEIPF